MSFANKRNFSNEDNKHKNAATFKNKKMAMNIKPTLPSKQQESTITKEFVKQQPQNKRKLSDSKANLKPFSQKDEIQKRLNLLKQNTLQIVSRNVKNAKRKMQVKDHAVLANQKNNTQKSSENTKDDNIISPSVSCTNSAVIHLNEKIGILRQTDDTTLPFNSSESLSTLQTTFSGKLSDLINIENQYQLKVPEIKLRTPIKEYIKTDEKNTPFWLKPSSLQTYPYNFIMAVRKKLESLSHPIQGPLQKKIKNYDDYADESKIRFESSESIVKKNSISDVKTNFSSISVNVEDSNTISDVSSIKSESIRNVENVDQKSDCSGAEKHIHSPLSIEKINNLRIQSDVIEFEDCKMCTNDQEKLNLQKFFEAFNIKLSQCIEVNKQLYSSLHNPQRTHDNFTGLHQLEYSEDFDNQTDINNASNNSKPLTNEKIRKDDSFSMRGNSFVANVEKSLFDLENKENFRSLMGSEILSVFNQFDLNNTVNSSAISESNLSYSNIGMYDQLIQSETSKSEHLTSIKKKREKYLIDWTKGQISWLELQRQKCKENGELSKITAIKKKQRALLMKLENRKSQNELIKTKERQQKTLKIVPFDDLDSSRILAKLTKKNNTSAGASLRGVKVFESNHSSLHLERILRDRETQLQKRREQVQNLIEWHQRLDIEEDELILMEKGLEKYNLHKNVSTVDSYSNKTTTYIVDVSHLIIKDQKRFNNIENSLNVLSNISSAKSNDHFVEVSGVKMNRLWKKLTGTNDLKFDQKIIYKLSKTDLEKLYEEAKSFVVKQFDDHKNLKKLLENSEIRSDSDGTLRSVKINESKAVSLESNNSIQYSSDFVSYEMDLAGSQSEKLQLKETSEIVESEESEEHKSISQKIQIIEMKEELPQLIAKEEEQLKTSEQLEIERNEISEVLEKISENNSGISTIDEITSLSYTHNPEDDNKNEDQSINFNEQDQNTAVSNEESIENISENIQESVDLEKRLISLDDCLKDLNTTFDVLNYQENSSEIKSTENISTDLAGSSSVSTETLKNSSGQVLDNFRLEVKIRNKQAVETVSVIKDLVVVPVEYICPSLTAGMPDIINEAEVLRRQQLQIEQEIQRLEQLNQAQAVFLREIPNKPPPPYQFPTVCPDETRIVEIIETQVKSLYENTELISLETTNIYERILSDVCKEVYNDFCNSAVKQKKQNYLNKLSLYNPPDFLKAMQLHILEKVKQLLLFDDKKLGGQNKKWWTPSIITGGKKRDLVDEILIREMFENNSNWTNFDLEELEVKDNIFNDIKKLMFAHAEN